MKIKGDRIYGVSQGWYLEFPPDGIGVHLSLIHIWSVYALFMMTKAQTVGDMDAVMRYMDEFYFESAAMILTLITVGKTLEARSKGRTTDALKSLMKLAPQNATIVRGGQEVTVPIGQVHQGDIFVVRPGEKDVYKRQVETPAAVMMSEELAELVDFFSIGTNDLTQYTLAIDRQNSKLDRFYNPHHEAVLRMIQRTIDGAHKHGRWVGICGELGADTALTERFVQMGIDAVSYTHLICCVRSLTD